MIIAISTVSDGSMYNRHDPLDPAVIDNREQFLAKNNITMGQSTMLLPAVRSREQAGEADFCRYQEVDKTYCGIGMYGKDPLPIDAIVTRDVGHALFLAVADCVA